MSVTSVIASLSPNHTPKPTEDSVPIGLTSDEARVRLAKDGPNAMPDTSAHPLRDAFAKFWAPVPWLLEASIVLELALHKYYEAAIIAGLLVFNAALAYLQEGRAQATLATQVASRAQCFGRARWRMEDCVGCGIGAWRRGETVAWRGGRSRCASLRRIGRTGSVDAHW